MPYDSPTTLRHRQQAAENKTARPRRRRMPIVTIPTEQEWETACEQALARLWERAEQGNFDSVKRCAQAMFRAAIARRALEIVRDFGCSIWKATAMARIELFGKEPA